MARILDRIRGRERHNGAKRAEPWRFHAKTHFETRRPLRPPCGLVRDWCHDPGQNAGVLEVFRPLLNDTGTAAAMERDTVPIPALEDRELYFPGQHLTYWLSGLHDLRMLERCVPASAFDHVLDFGGASGRVARHAVQAYPHAQVTIAELNINYIDWVNRYFGPSVRAVKVSPYPHFPLADKSVTLCVGYSVFTHIDTYESAWLAEIMRVLADGGHAVLTIHSEHCWPQSETAWQQATPHERMLLDTLARSPGFADVYQPGDPMPFDRMAFDYTPNSIEHNCNVFMHTDYIRQVWGKWLEVVDILPRAHYGFQAVVVLRKRPAS